MLHQKYSSFFRLYSSSNVFLAALTLAGCSRRRLYDLSKVPCARTARPMVNAFPPRRKLPMKQGAGSSLRGGRSFPHNIGVWYRLKDLDSVGVQWRAAAGRAPSAYQLSFSMVPLCAI